MYSPGFITALSMYLCVLAYQNIHKFKNKQKAYFIVLDCMEFCNPPYSSHL